MPPVDQEPQTFGLNHPALRPKIIQSAKQLMKTNSIEFIKAVDEDSDRQPMLNQGVPLWLILVTNEGELLGTDVGGYAPQRLAEFVERLRSRSLEVQVEDRALGRKV